MKIWLLLLALAFSGATAGAAHAQTAPKAHSASADTLLVDAACGQCRLGLPGKGCDLAVRVDGKPYFVTGTGIDAHGDAHARDGFCNAVRQARVLGQVVDNRFQVSYFQLVPQALATPAAKPKR